MTRRNYNIKTDNGNTSSKAYRYVRMAAALLMLLPVASCTDFLTEDLKGDFSS